ncbi:AAA family ATPase [Spiroplasma turonicum]|uniref:ATP-dependent Clp protease regulatory subunit n=1 Tax=Spiroplasma turonicum TaxID=216946 RepID=A0A0K1P6T1_9MOLU|nr:AAA family ATPase [Spiroplasma turonicum]AKU80003.1 ATP-dependent Clp protease regulatory subunit [Spiroplasma turonicum]ALX71005.1 hypothetical protein STURO_v1c07540 [Spiroplasma turonicum]
MRAYIYDINKSLKNNDFLLINGNVDDFFLINDNDGSFIIIELEDLIKNSVHSFQLLSNKDSEWNLNYSFAKPELFRMYKNSFLNYISKINNKIVNKKCENCIFLVYFDNKLSNDYHIVQILKDLLLNVKNKNQNINLANKVVLITYEDSLLKKKLTDYSINYEVMSIGYPTQNERFIFYKNFYNIFNFKEANNIPYNESLLRFLIKNTSSLNIKSIFKMSKVNKNDLDFKQFIINYIKEIYNIEYFTTEDNLLLKTDFINEKNLNLAKKWDIKPYKSNNKYYTKKQENINDWKNSNIETINSSSVILNKVIKGQKHAIEKIQSSLNVAFYGLKDYFSYPKTKKPRGVLFFVGPTGTGKTELAKQLAKLIFKDNTKFFRFDMSEYNHEHTDLKLIGSPPGYVGSKSGGQLTNVLLNNSSCVLLFDEVEKAHDKILDLFLQILDYGILTSSKNEVVSFENTFIIFTSNIGSKAVNIAQKESTIRESIINSVKKYFIEELKRPELLNRIGINNIIPFNFISSDNVLKEIIISKLDLLNARFIKKYNINIFYDKPFITNLIELLKKEEDLTIVGGRGVVNYLYKKIITPLSEWLLNYYSECINDEQYVDNILLRFVEDNCNIVELNEVIEYEL